MTPGKTVKQLNGALAGHHPWTPEEDEALMTAREAALQKGGMDWPATMKDFVDLGGAAYRSPGAAQQRYSVVKRARELEAKKAAQRLVRAARRAQGGPVPAVPGAAAPAGRKSPVSAPMRRLPLILWYVQDGVRLGVRSKEQAYEDLVGQLEGLLGAAAKR